MLDYSYRTILSVAIPLMGSTFIQSIVLLTDSSFLSRFGTAEFDAAGNAGLIYISFFMLLVGLNDGLQIIIARRIGQKKEKSISMVYSSGLLLNFILAGILFLVVQTILPIIITSTVANPALEALENDYLQMRSYGLFFSFISLSLIAYLTAIGKTRVVLISALLTAVSNILLDYLFIFGNASLPAMGIEGAALASNCADILSSLFLIISVLIINKKLRFRLLSFQKIRVTSIKKILSVSSPIMIQGLIALLTWTVFFFWIEQMGLFELTVSQNIRSIYFLAFVPIWGFAATTKTYVSQYLGKSDYEAIPIIMKRIQLLTILFLIVFFHGALLYPEKLIAMINPEQAYIQKSASILRFIFGSIFMYGFFSVYFQTISGSGNTRWTLAVEIASVAVYILFAYLFIHVFLLDIYWVWSVEYIYFGIMGFVSYIYLKKSNWKKKII